MGKTVGKGRTFRVWLSVLAAMLVSVLLGGCAAGVVTSSTYAAAGATGAAVEEKQESFREELKADYARYNELMASSGCDPDEYEIGSEILESIRDSAPAEDGFAEAQDVLENIYEDEALSDKVRAHALYLSALTEAEKEDGDPKKSRARLRRVTQEFPGSHDCAVNVLLERGDEIGDKADNEK